MSFLKRIRHPLTYTVTTAAASVAIFAAVWTRAPAATLTTGQVQNLLPPGAVIHSLAHLEMDGRPPQEVAVLAALPRYPSAPDFTYYAFVVAYDRWHRHFSRTYAGLIPGPLPLSVDAGRLMGDREAAVLAALHEDGERSYQVVGMVRGTVRVLTENRVAGRIVVTDAGLVAEDARGRRLLTWDGRRFQEGPAPARLPVWPSVTWRYGIRNGAIVVTRTSTVHLHTRQTLRLVGSGGGPIPIIISDSRLDIVENGGYRTRIPGTYTIRILIPYARDDQEYVLTVQVE